MKTVLFIITGNNGKKYAYNTEADVKVGDTVKIEKGNSLIVTDVLSKHYLYVNTTNGNLGVELTSTSDVKINTLVIREGDSSEVVYGQLIEKL